MQEQAHSGTELRKYLLDELSQEERARVEERLFLDSEYFQKLQAAEDELIDEYTYSELSPEELKDFESRFLSDSAWHTDLRIAKALKKHVALSAKPEQLALEENESEQRQQDAPPVATKTPFWSSLVASPFGLRFALALVILTIALGGIWLFNKVRRQSDPSHQAQTPATPDEQNKQPDNVQGQEERAQTVEPNTQNQSTPPAEDEPDTTGANKKANRPPSQTPARRPSAVYSVITLIPGGMVRGGGGITPLNLPANEGIIRLRMPLIIDTNYRSFRARLLTGTDVPVKEWSGLKLGSDGSGQVVSVNVPTKLFKQQQYRIELIGVARSGETEPLNSYNFQVIKK